MLVDRSRNEETARRDLPSVCVCVCNGFQHGTWKESDIKAEVTCIAKSPDGKNYAVG